MKEYQKYNQKHGRELTKKQFKMLESYKDGFLKQLSKNCIVYRHKGVARSESPMWFQFRGKDVLKKTLTFRSSQTDKLWFQLPMGDDYYISLAESYCYFRELKYSFIEKYYVNIYKQVKG